jgi:hypothetical protein
MFMSHVVVSLALVGAAHADKVSGKTGTGNNYTVSLSKAGKAYFPDGNFVQPAKIAVTYRDGRNYLKGAQSGVAWLRMSLASVKGGQSEKIDLQRKPDGTYQGTISTVIVEPLNPVGTIVPHSTVTFGSSDGKTWDSDFDKGYAGPTMPR